MTTKITAAQLRGMKAEHDKLIRDTAIKQVYQTMHSTVLANASKGNTKCSYEFMEVKSPHYNVDEEFISDCCSKIQEEFSDCLVEAEMEELPYSNRPYRKGGIKYTITVDWTEREPVEKGTVKEVSEVETLRAKITELEAEITKLKDTTSINPINSDLLDIFSGYTTGN
jgi:hypothetical protein